ncbi:YqgE/AlgH family protein [Gynuella sp.]|uniref:YqgE/AlgH family protein n=1 Tax=Gynuella sp. TaxID=2969146 RepID=UPI003D150748
MTQLNLSHYFLLAMPDMQDPYFARSVVYILEHDSNGAFGLIVNKPVATKISEVVEQLDITVPEDWQDRPVLYGGPVSTEQGFVLFETEENNSQISGSNKVAITTSIDTLNTIMHIDNQQFLLCMGYAGWGPGQLEHELQENGWLTVEADLQILFKTPTDNKYNQALKKLGIDPAMMSNTGGRV